MEAYARKRTRLRETRAELAVVSDAWKQQRTLIRLMARSLGRLVDRFVPIPFTGFAVALGRRRDMDILRGLARDCLGADVHAEQAGAADEETEP